MASMLLFASGRGESTNGASTKTRTAVRRVAAVSNNERT